MAFGVLLEKIGTNSAFEYIRSKLKILASRLSVQPFCSPPGGLLLLLRFFLLFRVLLPLNAFLGIRSQNGKNGALATWLSDRQRLSLEIISASNL